jgi:hypothetical protein
MTSGGGQLSELLDYIADDEEGLLLSCSSFISVRRLIHNTIIRGV